MKTDIVYGAMTLSSFRMKNDSDKIFGENQNPLLFIYLFIYLFENRAVYWIT